MMIIILVLILNLFLPYAYAAYDFQSADCIGGYEDPNADGVCTECPEGKASGDYYWKVYNNQANECIDVPITCGPGQLISAYSGGYFYCNDAQQGQYCPNGKCLYDQRSSGYNGANLCPSFYSYPPSDHILINDAEANVFISSQTSVGSTGYTYSATVQYSYTDDVFTTVDTAGAIMCTASDTLFCPPGAGNWGSGVVDGNGNSLASNLGFYSVGDGCYNCTAGTFQSGISASGLLTCTLCSNGQYSPERATECLTGVCAAGYGYTTSTSVYTSELHACYACDAGYYNDGTNLECQQCPG